MNEFISKSILDELSYTSSLRRSLKQISLNKTPIEEIMEDIGKYRAGYMDILIQENLIGSRFKSEDSLYRKYKKTLETGGGFKQCFNDVLGFRLHFDRYPETYPEYYRMVDLRDGKQVDDGYRAIHLYYQKDNKAYPIEIQLWCDEDYQFNVWSHKWLYKYEDIRLGKVLYDLYKDGKINNEEEFLKIMRERKVER